MQTACPLKVKDRAEFSKLPTSWIIVGQLPGNIVISRIDALMHVILSKVEKHVPYGEFSWYLRMRNAINDVSHKLKSL